MTTPTPSHPPSTSPSRVSSQNGGEMQVELEDLTRHLFAVVVPVLNDYQVHVANGFDALSEMLKVIGRDLNETKAELTAIKTGAKQTQKDIQDVFKRIEDVSQLLIGQKSTLDGQDKEVVAIQPKLDHIQSTLREMVEGIGTPSASKRTFTDISVDYYLGKKATAVTHEVGVNTEVEQTQACILTPISMTRRDSSPNERERSAPHPRETSQTPPRATPAQKAKPGKKILKVTKELLANALIEDLRTTSAPHTEPPRPEQSSSPPVNATPVPDLPSLPHQEPEAPEQPEPPTEPTRLTPDSDEDMLLMDSPILPITRLSSAESSAIQVNGILAPSSPEHPQSPSEQQLPSWRTLNPVPKFMSPLTDMEDGGDKTADSDFEPPASHASSLRKSSRKPKPPARATRASTSSAAKKKRKSEVEDTKGKGSSKKAKVDPTPSSSKQSSRGQGKLKVLWPYYDISRVQEDSNHLVSCDECSRYYHPPCVGLEDGDAELREDAVFRCPYCLAGESSIRFGKGREIQYPQCARADCTVEIYYEERVLGRRCGPNKGTPWLYLVKWKDYGVDDCTWEPGVNFNATLVDEFYRRARDEGIKIEPHRTDWILLKETIGVEGSWRTWLE